MPPLPLIYVIMDLSEATRSDLLFFPTRNYLLCFFIFQISWGSMPPKSPNICNFGPSDATSSDLIIFDFQKFLGKHAPNRPNICSFGPSDTTRSDQIIVNFQNFLGKHTPQKT